MYLKNMNVKPHVILITRKKKKLKFLCNSIDTTIYKHQIKIKFVLNSFKSGFYMSIFLFI